jgi:hypothetical protein
MGWQEEHERKEGKYMMHARAIVAGWAGLLPKAFANANPNGNFLQPSPL